MCCISLVISYKFITVMLFEVPSSIKQHLASCSSQSLVLGDLA